VTSVRVATLAGVTDRVLVVDDDATVRDVVARYLGDAGYRVDLAADGEGALEAAARDRPDAVVLDLMLPGTSGLDVCRALRAGQRPPAIVMLTALGEEDDRIRGLELGADDYVSKPFSPRELVLRVESVLRRAGERGGARGTVTDGDLVVDSTEHTATLAGRRLSLTMREFDLLRFLVSNPGEAFSRDELLKQVWGWSFGDQSTVTVHVRRLREKIEADPTHPVRLATVWGVGYRWEAAP
jgi:DNA-binding response OmpR family regulator